MPLVLETPILSPRQPQSDSSQALFKQAMGGLAKLPSFSPILSKLMASLAGEDVSFAVLGELIEKDAMMAGNLLRIVNSAVYSRRQPVNSVRHALAVLGLERVRNTVLGMSIARMLTQVRPPSGWSMDRFNRHSASVAILSDLMAQYVPTDYAEGAFVAGLLHDVGRLLIATSLPTEFQAMQAMHRTGMEWQEAEVTVLGFGHEQVSCEVLAAWKLPKEICEAARDHHLPGLARREGGTVALSQVLGGANQWLNAMGESIVAPASPPATSTPAADPLVESARERIAALQPRGGVDKLLAAFQAEYGSIAQFYCS